METALASTGFRDIALTDVATGKRIATFKEPGIVSSMAFSPDGTVLATGGSKVSLLDAATLQELPGLKSDTEVVGRVAFSPDGKLLASADRTVQLWEMATKKEITSLQQDRWISCMAFSPNGQMLATGTDRGVKLWDVGQRRTPAAFHGFNAESLVWSPDGKMLAVGEQNGTITLWNVPTVEPQAILEGHRWRISGLAFLPDGHTLVSASSRDKTIKLWDVADHLISSPFKNHIRITKSNKVKQLKLMVSVPRETAVDQPVDMLITLTNQGPEEIMLGRGNDSDNCTIQVLDSKKRACPLTPLGKQMMGRDGIDLSLHSGAPLKQGEFHTWIDLVKYFQLKPGKYTISVVVELNLHTHPFKIAVEDVEFEIIPTYSALYESSPFVKDNRAAKGKKNKVNYF